MLLLAACSEEAGPTPKGQPTDPGPGAMHVKLQALTADECFRFPDEVYPPNCQKYVTQLASIPERTRGYADADHPALTAAANDLDTGVTAYRKQKCEHGGDKAACAAALTDIARAVEAIKTEVTDLPGVGTQPN